MPRITIGLPIFNSQDLLDECLKCLQNQTFSDFNVLIYDNSSTDGTEAIAKKFVSGDSRFSYYRQPQNVGSAQNFIDVLNAADSEFFMWRADDDRSSDNFLQLMVDCLERNQAAQLAVGKVESWRPSRRRRKHFSFVKPLPGPNVLTILRQMYLSHPSWVYGVWRTKFIKDRYTEIWGKYPCGWAGDHLLLLSVILDSMVVGTDEATFVQQIIERGNGAAQRPAEGYSNKDFEGMITARLQAMLQYRQICLNEVNHRDWDVLSGLALRLLIKHYADYRIRISHSRLLRLRLRRLLT